MKYQLKQDLAFEQATQICKNAVNVAINEGCFMCIALVDAGGNLKNFVRMDEAPLGSIDIAIKKAKTSRFSNMSTAELGKLSQPGQNLYGIEVSNQGFLIFGGGELLKNKEGVIIGAIGVSGGTVEQDIKVAKGAIEKSKLVL
ncbi:MAG: heme-binding protein [Carboxylicivirga sp.]|jgi:uncharacterized protein GlcG (DUF336 family)|nr:heme-binding protein [Carboxylicivirga sp.]